MVKKVLIGLVEHMGDIIACEPITRILKKKYKSSYITWVAHPVYNEILKSNPHIDQIINVECLTEWIKISKHTKNYLIIDLHINFRECECCRIPLIKHKGNPEVTIHNWYDYGSLFNAFSFSAGLQVNNEHPKVYIQKSNIDAVNKLQLPEKYIVIHRISNDAERDWDEDKWCLLIKYIKKNLDIKIVEIGNKNQRKNNLPGIIDLRGITSILESAEIIRRSKAFIGIDSGPAHIANAVEKESVILLGSYKNFKNYNPYSGFFSKKTSKVRILRANNARAEKIELQDVVDSINYILKIPNTGLEFLSDNFREKYNTKSYQIHKSQKPGIVKTIAFYLPQFYPIPENNNAWGDGFVEWTSLMHTKPLFEGHQQPIEPGELGYYDLRSQEVLENQIKLAKDNRLDAFCFYYYYSAGKRILSKPLANFISSKTDFEFCICFANHNWTKKWDAGNSEVIFQQIHNDEDDEFLIENLIPLFKDKRYLKFNGSPIFLVFMPHLFHDIKKTTNKWREYMLQQGFPGIHLITIDDWQNQGINPSELGFDATYEMPSNFFGKLKNQKESYKIFSKDFKGKIFSYKEFKNFMVSRPFPSYKRYKTVMLPWDNSPRYKERGIITISDDLQDFKDWITSAYIDTLNQFKNEDKLLFIHSWNEWAEGTQLEPTRKHKSARLTAFKDAIDNVRKASELFFNNKIILDHQNLESMNLLEKILREKEEIIFRLEKDYYTNNTIFNTYLRYMSILDKILPLNSNRRKLAVKLIRKLFN